MLSISDLKSLHRTNKESSLNGRYITSDDIHPLLENLGSEFKVSEIGKSVNEIPIKLVQIGHGLKKVLIWSQMHGNESTSTKAVFDLFNAFDSKAFSDVLEHCTLYVLPMLNPDGAKAYTRLNANLVDLNRDAQNLSQPESVILRKVFDIIQPDFCFNLHGQRTIFSAGDSNKPATLSFLAPAEDIQRAITSTRKRAMSLISVINRQLQEVIPNQIGRYDDSFNLNCVGDTFQSLNTPTLLFEAGHFNNDYQREETRRFMFCALVIAINTISQQYTEIIDHKGYFEIPENKKLFYDVIIRNATIDGVLCDVAIQFQENLVNDAIEFLPKIEKIEDLSDHYGHKEVNAESTIILNANREIIEIGEVYDTLFIGDEKFSLKFTIS